MAHVAWVAAGGTLAVCLVLAFWLMTVHAPGPGTGRVVLASMHGAQAVLAVAVVATGLAHWRSVGRVHGARLAVAGLALMVVPVVEVLVVVDVVDLRAGLHAALGSTAVACVARAVWGPEVDTGLRVWRECRFAAVILVGATVATSVVGAGAGGTPWRAALVAMAWSVVAVAGLSRSARRGWVLMAWVSWAAVAFAVSEVARAASAAVDPRWTIVSETMAGAGLLVAAVGGTWVLAVAARSNRSDVYGTLLDGLTMQEQAEGRRRELAHEVRNAVFVLEGAVTGIGRDGGRPADESLRELQRVVGSGLACLRQLVDEPAVGDELTPIPLDAVVADCVSATRARQVPVELACDDPVVVRAQPALVERAVTNLVVNAERHGGAGAGGPVAISVERDDERGTGVVRVRDPGPGIPPGQRASVFAPGVQVGTDRSGDGLGLSVARDLVHRQGGDLWYEDGHDGGACFAFSLPLAETVLVAAHAQLRHDTEDRGQALDAD